MGFLDQFRKTRDAGLPEDWQTIETELQLQAAIDESFQKPVALFKHSVTCGISANAKYRLESEWDFNTSELSFYYLDLLSYRAISNKIAADLAVIHQSPQVILLKDGKAVFNTSHHAINVAGLRQHI